jgi:hypothetical protein
MLKWLEFNLEKHRCGSEHLLISAFSKLRQEDLKLGLHVKTLSQKQTTDNRKC